MKYGKLQGKVVKKSPKKDFGKRKMREWSVEIVQRDDKLDLHKENEKEKDCDSETPSKYSLANETGNGKLEDSGDNGDVGSDDSQASGPGSPLTLSSFPFPPRAQSPPSYHLP